MLLLGHINILIGRKIGQFIFLQVIEIRLAFFSLFYGILALFLHDMGEGLQILFRDLRNILGYLQNLQAFLYKFVCELYKNLCKNSKCSTVTSDIILIS